MNAVEIEQAVSELAIQPFDAVEFPYQFLAAFGQKDVALRRLRSGNANLSDVPGGVLLRNTVHMAVAEPGEVAVSLAALRASAANVKGKPKFLLATDGQTLEADDLATGDTIACAYGDLPNHFGFLLPLAGISTIKEIKDNPIDVRATSRLNKLYVTLLAENPDWATEARRADMNHFMARLIFCFFAEDTGIFQGESLFTRAIEQMTERDGSNVHLVLSEIFRAMDIHASERAGAEPRLPAYAIGFPYVNGALFSGSTEVPRFTRMARTYLLHAGALDWKAINPDIFGSMIQAVADDEERGALGMHYTSVPNILKLLNPLFLDDLSAELEAAGQDKRKLLALRRRIARIRVFDPACGSGNFLVIAYKRMRAIEAEINDRRGERNRKSEIPLTNFRGIELRDFPAEIARLALIIAEFQSDEMYRGQREAIADFLPLAKENWIVCGNALRLDWLAICPPTGTGVQVIADDFFTTPHDQAEIDFENEGGETYICGNPPFTGTRKQSDAQKNDLEAVFSKEVATWKNVDYVGAWLLKAAQYNRESFARFAFVATNSLCQGQQVPIVWALLAKMGCRIRFAHHSFKWSNLARNLAGVTVVIVGVDNRPGGERYLFTGDNRRLVDNINPYLTEHNVSIIRAERTPRFTSEVMDYGVYYSRSAGLILSPEDKADLLQQGVPARLVRRFLGSTEFINGGERYCLWLESSDLPTASTFAAVVERIESVRRDRLSTDDKAVNKLAITPYQFRERKGDDRFKIFVPIVSSENREYFPVGVADETVVPTNKAFFMANAPMWCLAILSSRIHLVWVATICGRLRTDFSYSNTLGWNTFPIPSLTDANKADLAQCAEAILLAREAHFPKTIADLYEVRGGESKMPENLRRAHERNDEVLERIYIGRKFRNDTERLEKLFDLYTKMAATAAKKPAAKKAPRGRKA